MAYLEKLLIQGMRSFGVQDDENQKMSFCTIDEDNLKRPSPLTIILGPNGCGKTTIIECLKYVTTGDYPPGSNSGRSFVHDPKMAGSAVVKGVVKLTFRGIDNCKYSISRGLEGSQKPKTIGIRSIAPTFSRENEHGEIQTLSMKCADFNSTLLDNLGVSKAILNYVIFCHQEDSNWPLDEGSKVKAKFDEIFASDKYQNCLKALKEVAKKQREKMNMNKNNVKFYKDDTNLAKEKRRELEEKRTKVIVLEEGIAQTSAELKPIEEALRAIRDTVINYEDLIRRQQNAQTRKDEKRKQIDEIERSLSNTFNDGLSDEELEDLEKTLIADKKNTENKIMVKKKMMENIATQIENDEREKSVMLAHVEKCRLAKAKDTENKQTLEQKVRGFSRDFNWSLNPVSTDKNNRDAISRYVKQEHLDCEQQIKSIEKDMEKAVEEKSDQVQKLETKKALLDEKKNRTHQDVSRKRMEMKELEKELKKVEEGSERLGEVKSNLEVWEKKLDRKKSSFSVENARKKIDEKLSELRDFEKRAEELRAEKIVLDENQEISAKEEAKFEREEKLDLLWNRIKPKLQGEVFQDSSVPDIFSLKDKFNKESERAAKDQRLKEVEVQDLKYQLSSKEEQKKQLKCDIKVLEEKMSFIQEELEKWMLNECDIDEELKNLRKQIESSRSELAQKEANKYTFQEFVNRLNSEDLCPTCSRGFKKKDEAKKLKAELEDEIVKIPTRVQAMKTKIETLETRQQNLQMLIPQKNQLEEFKDEVAKKEISIKSLETEIRKMRSNVQTAEDDFNSASSKNAICEELREKVVELDILYEQVEEQEAELNQLKAKSANKNINLRSMKEFQAEDEKVNRKVLALNKEIKAKEKHLMETEREILQMESEVNKLNSEMLSITKDQQNLNSLSEKRTVLKNSLNELEAESSEIVKEFEEIRQELSEARMAKNRVVKAKEAKLEEARKQAREIGKAKEELDRLIRDIQTYEDQDQEREYESKVEQFKEVEKRRKSRVAEKFSLEKEKEDLDENIRKFSDNMREIQDLKRIRKLIQDEKEHKNEVEQYENSLKALNYHTEVRRKEELTRKYQELERKRAEKAGRLSEAASHVRSLERELANEKFASAAKNFRKECLSVRVRQHVIDDLEKYHKALSFAISRFHKEKMNVINRIIRELWRATYRGNDIDYIEIKTDDVDPNASMEKRKTCNYKVVMYKNNTEMEMRGRCSAGQKVLASLIIRLALAETFSSNCGIFALDEPTTNLDHENIASLAEALAEIVQRRSEIDNNFQLVMITHDEELIQMMGRHVHAVDHYYRISRNNRGLSQITKTKFD